MRNFFIFIFTISLFGFSQNNPKIIDMQGMTDARGISYLVYRLSPEFNLDYDHIIDSDLYIYNTLTNTTDTLFTTYTDQAGERGEVIGPIDFWDNDPKKFIRYFNPYQDYTSGVIQTYFYDNYFDGPGVAYYSGYPIIISSGNRSIVYLSKTDSLYVSADSGLSWKAIKKGVTLIAINPFDEKYLYAVNSENQLLFSGDTGKTFEIADGNNIWNIKSQLEFDKDNNHIYAITENNISHYFLVSDNSGKPASWTIKEEKFQLSGCPWYVEGICSDINSFLQLITDDSLSGRIYLSEGSVLYKSLDYGNTLVPDTIFQSQISGLYLVPGTDTLFITSSYQIQKYYDKTMDTILDLHPASLDQFYPLNNKDTWIYFVVNVDQSSEPTPTQSQYYTKIEVIGDSLMEDGYTYKKVKQTVSYNGRENLTFQRVYKNTVREYTNNLYYNLSGIPGDSHYLNWYLWTTFLNEKDTLFWDSTTIERSYLDHSRINGYFKLLKGFGQTYSYHEYDFGTVTEQLMGAVINGKAYGDTSFITALQDPPGHPNRFVLKQNYPNPFNPNTIINYQLAINSHVIIKIFDPSGREIQTLLNTKQNAGDHSVTFDGSSLASGIYFYRIKAGKFTQTRKMVLIK